MTLGRPDSARSGTFGGEPTSAPLRYTRTWSHDDEAGWRVLAVNIVVLPPPAWSRMAR